MGQPAARLTDTHSCPMVDPGPIPHVGLPVTLLGSATVLIGGEPAARVGDQCACDGPLDPIVRGSNGVFILGAQAARMGDPTGHGGKLTSGCTTVLIGDTASGDEDGDDDEDNGFDDDGSDGDDEDQGYSLEVASNDAVPLCIPCLKT